MKCIVFAALLACILAAPTEVSLPELIINTHKNIDDLGSNVKAQLKLQGQENIANILTTHSWKLVDNVNVYIAKITELANLKGPKFNELWTTINDKLAKAVFEVFDNATFEDTSAKQLQEQFIEAIRSCIKEATRTAESAQKNSGDIEQEIAGHTKEVLAIALQIIKSLNTELKGEPGEHSSKKYKE